jgi:prephenate dehydratase
VSEFAPEVEPAPAAAAQTAPVRVAFQGEPGAYSEQAIVQLWRGGAEPVPMRSFDDVMDAAESGRVEYGMLPIESTLAGGIDVAYDLLALHDRLLVAAETIIEIHLSVLALPGATLRDVQTLYSHPVMLTQCAHFLEAHKHIAARPTWDTAGAARYVAERGDPTMAAAAGPLCAERFGLIELARDIEDRPDSLMRFLAVAPDPVALGRGTPARTAMLCDLPQTAGALLSIIQPLARQGYNISHFTSRPTREAWSYQLFIEFEHEAQDPAAAEAVAAIKRASTVCRLMGTYPRWMNGVEERRQRR